MILPLVAIVGRPNVGKSTLFNRLVGRRLAIVEDIAGTTRDRLVASADWTGVTFDVVDTGGLALVTETTVDEGVRNQVAIAVEEADVIVFLADAVDGLTAADEAVAEVLRRSGKPVVVAVNKADNESRRLAANEFWSLGLGEPHAISALHGSGTGDLLDEVVVRLRDAPPIIEEESGALRLAVVGRPNVGKSSLVNQLLGSERVVVSEIPGTTRDAVDTHLMYGEREVVLVDTAGIRRRGKVEQGIEKYSVLRAMRALGRADVAVLVIDAEEGAAAQDAHIAGAIVEAGVGAILAANKWDVVVKDTYTADEFEKETRDRIKFLDYAPFLTLSALTGQRTARVLELAAEIDTARRAHVPTSALNRLVADIQARHNPPSKFGKRLRIYYATQIGDAPPTFAFFVNDTRLVHFTYERFVENQLRRSFPFTGSPIRLQFRARDGEEQSGR